MNITFLNCVAESAKKALRHAILYTPNRSEVQMLLREHLHQLNQIEFVYPCTTIENN
jgi:pyridoxal/pyridoxine/pyridoxamine kinase